jgi:hypothetical protein
VREFAGVSLDERERYFALVASSRKNVKTVSFGIAP